MNFLTKYILPYAKAHVAGLTSGLVLAAADMQAGSVSATQWEAVALTALGVAGATALVPNKTAGAVAIATAVVHDVAPVAVVKDVVQDATQVIPVVQAASSVVEASVPAPVAADIANVVAAAEAVVAAVAPVAAPAAPPAG